MEEREGKYYGLVDIGSNTIHGVVFKVCDDGSYSKVLNQKESTELISYISEDGMMSDDGRRKLCEVIASMKQIFDLTRCDEIDFFATSSLRNVKNQEELLAKIESRTGVRIRILSGDEEAYYDYVSMKACICQENAVGLDLGGGSGQIIQMKNGELVKSSSMEFGCLRMYNRFVKGIFPEKQEQQQIKTQVKKMLADNGTFEDTSIDTLYVMGGTARACAKFHRSIEETEKKKLYCMDRDELDNIIDTFETDAYSTINTVNRLFPDRMCTILPGIIIIRTIAKYLGAEKICVLKNGIREGVLLKEFIG